MTTTPITTQAPTPLMRYIATVAANLQNLGVFASTDGPDPLVQVQALAEAVTNSMNEASSVAFITGGCPALDPLLGADDDGYPDFTEALDPRDLARLESERVSG